MADTLSAKGSINTGPSALYFIFFTIAFSKETADRIVRLLTALAAFLITCLGHLKKN